MARSVWLTTIDNPFDPCDEFMAWLQWDIAHGHKTCEMLDIEARTSSELSNSDNKYYVETAIDKLVELYPWKFKKVIKET